MKKVVLVGADNDTTLARTITRNVKGEEVIGHKMKTIDASILAEAMAGGGYNFAQVLRRKKGKGNKGQQAKQVARRRVANRLARKNRRLNLRKGNVAGRQ